MRTPTKRTKRRRQRPKSKLIVKYGEPEDALENAYKVYQWDAATAADQKAVDAAFAKVVDKAVQYALSVWHEDEPPSHANYAFKCIGGKFHMEVWLRAKKGGSSP